MTLLHITLKWSYHLEFAFVPSTGTSSVARGLRFVCVLGEVKNSIAPYNRIRRDGFDGL